jgi:DNA gyrase/topoisomerase IV subunit A
MTALTGKVKGLLLPSIVDICHYIFSGIDPLRTEEFIEKGRAGQGVRIANIDDSDSIVLAKMISGIEENDVVFAITNKFNVIRTPIVSIERSARVNKGNLVKKFDDSEKFIFATVE